MSLTLIPTAAPQPAWCSTALANIDAHAYDHPDIDQMRETVVELAATEDRLAQIAARACRHRPIKYAAEELQWLAAEIVGEARDWNDDRDNREANDRHGNRLDVRRGLGER